MGTTQLISCECGRGLRDRRAARCRLCWAEAQEARAAATPCPRCGGRRTPATTQDRERGKRRRFRCRACEAADARGRPRNRFPRVVAVCAADEPCDRQAITRGLCGKHYDRLRITGTTLPRIRSADPARAIRRSLRSSASALRLDPDVVVAYFEAHSGLCDVCGRPPTRHRLHVDHDHATGVFRGLLCLNCNQAAGLLGDDVERIRALADYLVRPR